MNKKFLFLLAAGFFCYLSLQAQPFVPATKEQQRLMSEKITAASLKMESLTCDFEQTKELALLDEKMISKGKMYYRQDGCLRWEYLSPYVYTFILNDKKILMQTGKSRNVVDIRSNRLFQEVVKIMMNSINGNSLTDTKSFRPAYYWGEKEWKIVLVPLQKELKKMFASIELTLNVNDYSVDTIRMNEPNGDTTTIRLSGKQFNPKIQDEKFAVD
ncbi:MAG: outer membrane lipoprotein carrier protein LolA [Dysgonamonadaceae bacterium]|jgi:outer membrane lipoprotein carrier protein|nr:outer membrane lipoprotein carrier protein LolA [Dysgonamonadaceae bacterium]